MKKRSFSPEFKAKIVLMVLQGDKTITEIANENQIAPNLIHLWKDKFLENAPSVFDNEKEKEYKKREAEYKKTQDDLLMNISQLMAQINVILRKSEKTDELQENHL